LGREGGKAFLNLRHLFPDIIGCMASSRLTKSDTFSAPFHFGKNGSTGEGSVSEVLKSSRDSTVSAYLLLIKCMVERV